MKNITNYIKSSLNESRTGDFLMTVADCVKDKSHITDDDIKEIIALVKNNYGFELQEKDAKEIAKAAIDVN